MTRLRRRTKSRTIRGRKMTKRRSRKMLIQVQSRMRVQPMETVKRLKKQRRKMRRKMQSLVQMTPKRRLL